MKTTQRTCPDYSGTNAKPHGLWAYHVLWACHISQAPSTLLLLPTSSHCPSRSHLLLLSGLGVNMPCPLSHVLAGSSAHSKDLRMICELQYRYSTLSLRSLPSTSSTSVLSIVFKGMKALLQACSQKKPITRAIIVPLAYAVEEGGGSSE